MHPKIIQWQNWLGQIEVELVQLVWSKSVYLDWYKIVTDNPEISQNNHFWEWLEKNHVESTLMGIRRQTDSGSHAISMIKLIRDIEKNSSLLNRVFYQSLYPPELQHLADEQFDNILGPKSDHYPQTSAKEDVCSLEILGKSVRSYINRRLAHFDRRPPSSVGTLDDLHQGITTLETLFSGYRLVLKAESGPLLPIVEYDWKAIFSVPWIKPDPTDKDNATST